MVKGILQKVTEEGLAIQDKNGKYLIIRAKSIIKIKVHKKGLTLGKSVVAGTGLGLGLDAAIFFSDEGPAELDTKIFGTAIVGGVGAVGGLAGGAVAELLNLRVVLLIENNEARYRDNYKKLERYSKERYMEPQAAMVKP